MEMFHGAFLNPLLAWLENWLNTLTHICIYMVFTNNNRKHFCSSQSALPSVDNSMLIITQHITESKLTVMQTQLQFKETKEICREAKCLHKNTFAYLNNGMWETEKKKKKKKADKKYLKVSVLSQLPWQFRGKWCFPFTLLHSYLMLFSVIRLLICLSRFV